MNNRYSIEDVKKLVSDSSALLFDFDGTLVNLDKLNVDSFALVFKEMFSIDFTREDFMKYISGRGSKNGIVEYLQTKGIKEFSGVEINNQFYTHKKRLIEERIDDEIYLLPGIKDFLNSTNIKEKRKIIVTSSRKEHVKKMLTHFNLFENFETVIDRYDVVRGKPDPECFLKGLEYLGLPSSQCLVFEDSFYGLQASKVADIFTIGILNDGWNEDFVYQLSDFVIENYSVLI
ncbi:HAD family phosphatase [Candidatus Dojkabacteria bacterium]|uniref:HAD family phosphatase n=1 Tax=Candidatus Dojkabacteria bacterium TaxID=2099670 RepID=A0A847EU79_9BACT|nr:HAD family phosphatase [Candidatus Dojkabacteria bacterium]